ncbi:hypothetical protein UVI_02012100 [Ustilaginoidea virens]|uniref:Uncharacterized protein n=1 Tax=Ustilaginoidea virens TaxID=1159556 RepID=A0A1B5L1J9_USTVR|nr:hypothetical protein UVI_02012100 [Ustilaginoidea virens]
MPCFRFVKNTLNDGVKRQRYLRNVDILLQVQETQLEIVQSLLRYRNARLGIDVGAAPGSVCEMLAPQDVLGIISKTGATRKGFGITAVVQQISRLLKLISGSSEGDLANGDEVLNHAFGFNRWES